MSTLTTPADRTIHTGRILNAPRDCVWRAFTEPDVVAKWWGRGHVVDVERYEFQPGGHWRFVEHHDGGVDGFEGRFREISGPDRVVQTSEWDGMPGHVSIETATFVDMGDGRTKVITDSLFHTQEERDGMLQGGMQEGMDESYAALDTLLATLC
jgi:uncharacterized protein YndB with AHSA1/START domain